MNDREFQLLMQRIDDNRKETDRRFDELAEEIHEIKVEVTSITKWQWKIGGIGIAFMFIISLVFETGKAVIEKLK